MARHARSGGLTTPKTWEINPPHGTVEAHSRVGIVWAQSEFGSVGPAHGLAERPDVRSQGKNFLAGDVDFPCWSMTDTPLWPHGLLEPRAMGSPPRQRWRSWCALSHAAEHHGRDLTENPQRQPESFSSCGGATHLARSCQAAHQADTWCTVYGVDSTTAQLIGVLPFAQ